MRNTTLDSQFEFNAHVGGHGQVSFVNSTIAKYGSISCFDDSLVEILDSRLTNIGNQDRSRVIISDSEILWGIDLWFLLPSQVVFLEEVKPGFCRYWNLHENRSASNVLHDLTVKDTFVFGWGITIDGANVTILNSEFGSVICGFVDTNVIVDGAQLRFYTNWTLGKITLLNTSVTGYWGFAFENCLAEVSNVMAGVFLHKHSNLSIVDSIVSLDAYFYTGGAIQFQNSQTYGFEALSSSFYIYGEIDFLLETNAIRWLSTNVTRNYNIISRNLSGNPMENVELTLFDQNYTVVWSGLTDISGTANFNITFSDNNYTDTLRLEAVKGDFVGAMNVSFLSDTPIVLTMRYYTDLNGDGKINIQDLFIVARAYGTKERDENYNPIADLDGNKEINIKDLYEVAEDYGKTI